MGKAHVSACAGWWAGENERVENVRRGLVGELAERRVLARRGLVGEMDDRVDHPYRLALSI
ncbi:MAG TPA: hypothetical protein VF127_15380, partial [Nitrospira sp.]